MSIPPPSSASSASQFTYSAPSTSSTQTNTSYFPTPFHLQQPYVVAAPPAPAAAPPSVGSVYTAPVGPVYSIPQFQQFTSRHSSCFREMHKRLRRKHLKV
ncbi:unnamed protein product [Linum tenue]|uniref:Uncharacterized protein n=1 Tax=Linum tenue TaxID=586396 RepID=A0AAV0P320_9ROSI|nr:unnamed protein product [Linum tenue]